MISISIIKIKGTDLPAVCSDEADAYFSRHL